MNNRFSQVRNGKYFSKYDIIVYAIVVILVVALFVAIFVTKKDNSLEKILVYSEDNLVYSYDFFAKNGEVTEKGKSVVKVAKENNNVFVLVTTEKGYNKIKIDSEGAKVVEANCSFRADCVHSFDKIKNGGEIIVCLPHNLKVVGIGKGKNEVLL